MSLHFTTTQTPGDLHQILALQQQNHKGAVSDQVKREQGFLTVRHTWDQLSAMHQATPQVIARDGESVAGYALAMLPSLADLIPDLQPMFTLMNQIAWREKPLSDSKYYVMGQVCVGEGYRGQGVFDGLYEQHRKVYSNLFELLVTEVSVGNTRSMRAHERVGFRTVHTHTDAVDTWNVLAWEFTPEF